MVMWDEMATEIAAESPQVRYDARPAHALADGVG